MRKFLLILSLCILAGCSKDESEADSRYDGLYYHDLPKTSWAKETLKRSEIISGTAWTPLSKVPKAGKSAGYFPMGVSVSGIPYSAVSAEEGSVGIQTSFYTFLSAVSDPQSTLYSVDYRSKSTYLKAARYGCVCSSAVMYAWGCAFGYYTEQIYNEEVPFIVKKEDQSLDGLKLCDGLCYYESETGGHIMMAYDIARDANGVIKKVSIFESSAPTAHITVYTIEQLKERISRFAAPIKIFSCDSEMLATMEPLPDYVEQTSIPTGPFPSEICVQEGDKRTFAKGKRVTLDILSDDYDFIQLFKDESIYITDDVLPDSLTYENLPVGMYKARLSDNEGKTSEYTYFEIGEVDYSISYDGVNLTITCPSNTSRPVYVTMNGGDKQLLKRSDTGSWTLTPKAEATYCRVHFAGKYSGYSGLSKQFK